MRIIRILFILIIFSAHALFAEEFNIPPATCVYKGLDGNFDIRIWGWSRTGKAALSTERTNSEAGGITVRFCIINLITDDIVYEWSSFLDLFELHETDELNSIISLYETKKTDIIKAMNSNGIIGHHAEFSEFPFTAGNFTYTAFTKTAEVQNEWPVPRIIFDIIVARNGIEKTIRTAINEDAKDMIFGYYKSPFENRILVISGTSLSSHGGIIYNLSGCHLSVGFN